MNHKKQRHLLDKMSIRCRCIMKGHSKVVQCQFVHFLLFPFPLFALGFLSFEFSNWCFKVGNSNTTRFGSQVHSALVRPSILFYIIRLVSMNSKTVLKRPELRPYPSRNDFDSTSFIENGFPQASKSADEGLSLIIAFLDNFCWGIGCISVRTGLFAYLPP